jgi:hypothetical protein
VTDQSGLQPEPGSTETTMYRRGSEAGLEPASDQVADYRDQLKSSRWNAAPLENPEAEKSDPRYVVLGVVILSAITLAVLVLGYGSGFWS